MRKTFTALAALTLVTLASGCAGPFTDVTKTSMGYESPSDPNKIEILYLKPEGNYKEVASVITEGWNEHDVAKIHNALRDKVATTGATAVVLLQPYFTYDGWGNRYIGYTGVAIKK